MSWSSQKPSAARRFMIEQCRAIVSSGVFLPTDNAGFIRRVVFFDDCEKACRALPLMLPSPPKNPLITAPRSEDDARADFAPSLDFLRRMKSSFSQYDVATLDPIDAADFQRELDWCDDWLDWYSRH